MSAPGHDILIKDAVVFLVAAGFVVPVLRAGKLPAVVGFILAGVALGPSGLGALALDLPILEFLTVSEPEAAAPFAELGVLFLLFLLGLELSFQKLWALRRLVFGAGAAQAGLSAIAIGFALYAAGIAPPAATLIGLAFALSSTAIVMQSLIEHKRTSTPVGRTALGVLLFQDILVAPILIFAGFMTHDAGDHSVMSVIWEAAWKGISAIVVILFIGRFLLAPLYRLAAGAGGRDFLMAITLLTVVGAAVITASAGLSLALGAFLAGLMLGETEFKHQTEVDLEPFKGLLLGLFFMTVGMSLDLSIVLEKAPIILAALCGLIAIKASIAAFAVKAFGGDSPTATESAGLLAPAGEFAFVILATGAAGGIVSHELSMIATATAVLSMLGTPLTWKLGEKVAKLLQTDEEETADKLDYHDLEGHVIIAGFGRVGQAVAHILSQQETQFVALERDPKRVASMRKEGWKVYLGDGARGEMLNNAGIQGAALVLVTLNDPVAAVAMVQTTRRLRPAVTILVRAKDTRHAQALYAAGANFVVPDAIEAGLQMAARALEEFGYEGEYVRDSIAAHRDAEYRAAMQSVLEKSETETKPSELKNQSEPS